MSRPFHHRGLSGGSIGHYPFDHNYMKDSYSNGYGLDPSTPIGISRSHQNPIFFLLKLAFALIVIIALSGSLYWISSIPTSPQNTNFIGYRRLQEQLVNDLLEIGELSLGESRLKEVPFCAPEFENYVPCYYNVSETLDLRDDRSLGLERKCDKGMSRDQGCLVLPPKNYRIPLRWPTGRDFIWKENVRIKRNKFSSGGLTKRMMVEEEQISFRSNSLMVDGVEDYSHQIAEMIGLRNESISMRLG